MPAITCCPPHSFKALLPTEEKWEKALVAISVGSLSTQGLFRPLPPITWLIGNHLSHTWMSSSHEEEVRPPAGGNKTLFAGFHYRRRSTLSPLTDHRHQELEKLLKPRASASSSAKKGPFLKSFLLIMSILHLVAFIRPSKTLFRSRYVYFYKTGLFQPQDHFNFSTQFSFPLQ